MAVYGAHQCKVKMDVTAGASVLTDISAGVTAVTFSPSKAVGVHHTFGDQWQQATEGGITTEFSITARIENGTTCAYHYLVTALTTANEVTRTFELYVPVETGSSGVKWAGEGRVAGGGAVAGTAGSGDAQTATFTIVTDGAWTKSVAT